MACADRFVVAMTAETYYRRAAFLPVAVPVLAFVLLLVLSAIGEPAKGLLLATDDVAGFLVIAGLLSLLPYGLFVGIALSWAEPSTEADYRRLSWLAPGFIALPFGLVMGLFALGSKSLVGAVGSFATWGLLALGVGYFYAVLINLGLFAAKRLRYVTS
jgi:hypothetical protein